MAAATLLGGGTRSGFSGDVVVQILAIVLLVAVGLKGFERSNVGLAAGSPARGRLGLPFMIVGLFCALVTLQLLPLPPELWSKLPSSKFAISGILDTGAKNSWHPISLTPYATWASATSVLVPVAIFFGVTSLDAPSRLKLCWLVLALGAIALVLGLVQVAQGSASGLRFFEITNPTEAVGFFANRNHFAAQLYVTLVLAAVLFVPTVQASLQPGALNTRAVFWFACAAAFVIAIMAGLAMARSRAGVFLAMAAIVGIAMMVLTNRRADTADKETNIRWSASRISLAVVGFAFLFALQFGLHRILTRFATDPLEDLRIPLFHTTFETALKALPFGTGLGSFVPVYASVEKTTDIFRGYANRAHNDIVEFLLEAGVFGALILLMFLFWFLARVYTIWFHAQPERSPNGRTYHLLQQASTIVIALILAHSFVDYPLRTTALAALFAFSCAVLVPPMKLTATHGWIDQTREHGEQDRTPGQTIPQPDQHVQHVLRKRWGDDVEWPEEWRDKNGKE